MFSDLIKARQHKYIKRVPKAGGGYTYFYREQHGGGVALKEHMKEGAAFRLTHNGQEGHFHIKALDGERLTVEHDESGARVEMTRDELAALLTRQHRQALQADADKKRARAEKLKRETPDYIGNKRAERLAAEAEARLKVGEDIKSAATENKLAREVLEKARVTPEKVAAALASFSKSRGRTSTNPDVMFTARLQELTTGDTAAYCESYNKALERAAQENAAVLSAIEVYKQAKIEALAANPDPIIADEARFKYIQEHTQNERRAFDEAEAAYRKVLKEANNRESYADIRGDRAQLNIRIAEYETRVDQARQKAREADTALKQAEIPVRAEAERLYPEVTHAERQENIRQYINAASLALLKEVSAANADFLYKTLYPADVLHARHQQSYKTEVSVKQFDLVGELAHIEDILGRAYPARAQDDQTTFIHISRPKKGFREQCKGATIYLTTRTNNKVAAHELAHTLERRGQAYEGIERAVTLTHLTRINQGAYKQYKGKELYFEDQYTDNYIGKLYDDGQSEMVSMGVENFFTTTDAKRQAWDIALFAAADPHHYLLTYAILKGYTQP